MQRMETKIHRSRIPVAFGLLTFCLCLVSGGLSAQSVDPSAGDYIWEEYGYDWEEPVEPLILRDTIYDTLYISTAEDVTSRLGLTFDEYVRRFLVAEEALDTADLFSPESLYLNYFLPLLRSTDAFFSRRLVVREYTLSPSDFRARLQLTELPYFPPHIAEGVPLDVMLTCYGEEATTQLLHSPAAIEAALEQLFASVCFSRKPIQGVNLYFPDYNFRNKRQMAQLIKSVSLVTDSMRVASIRGMKLYVTFDRQAGLRHRDFLCCLTQMADSVLLLDRHHELYTFPVIEVIDHADAGALSVPAKIRNQLYLARYRTGAFPEVSADEFRFSDLRAVMYSDYPDNVWQRYFWGLIGILLILLAFGLVYRFSPEFAYRVNSNLEYMLALLVMVLLEFYLLLFAIFEGMSKDDVFTFGENNRNTLLLMPLLFLFLLPGVRALRRRRKLP